MNDYTVLQMAAILPGYQGEPKARLKKVFRLDYYA
jgi:hypothetical protein